MKHKVMTSFGYRGIYKISFFIYKKQKSILNKITTLEILARRAFIEVVRIVSCPRL